MPRRAYSYARYSSSKQRKGRSAKRQLEWAPKVCKAKGWQLDDAARLLDDGVAAFRGQNSDTGALAAFLQDIETGLVPRGSVLLVESLDRLSREEVDVAWDLWKKIVKAGVSIQTREPDRYYEAEKPIDVWTMLEVLFIFARAHEESKTKSMRISDIWNDRRRFAREAKKPRGKRVHFWLEFKGGKYHLRPDAAAAIREAFRLAREGLGRKRLLASLLNDSSKSPAGPSWPWTMTELQRVLTGRAVLGEYQPKRRGEDGKYRPDGQPIEGYYPAVVTENEWLEAQSAAHGRKRRAGRPASGAPNLFTGMVWHARAKMRVCLITEGWEEAGKRYRYLGLRKEQRLAAGDQGETRWRYDHFEEAVLSAIEELQTRDVLPPSPVASAAEKRVAELTRRATALSHRVELLKARIADPDQEEEIIPDLEDSLKRVRTDQSNTAAELAHLKLTTDAGRGEGLAQLQTLVELWRDSQEKGEVGTLGDRIRIGLRRVVDEVWVLPQRLTRQKTILHVQIYLKSGRRRYLQVLPTNPPADFSPWQLEGSDLRSGQVGD